MKTYNDLKISWRDETRPFGIRDDGGFLIFFREVIRWAGQDERYEQECKEQRELAEFVLENMKGC